MNLQDVERGLETPGRRHMARHLRGERITLREAVAAKCFECMCGYADGRADCKISTCALYQWMPFREVKPPKRPANDPNLAIRLANCRKQKKELRQGATLTPPEGQNPLKRP